MTPLTYCALPLAAATAVVFVVGFFLGGLVQMYGIRRGAVSRMTADEQHEMDRLVEQALAKGGDE